MKTRIKMNNSSCFVSQNMLFANTLKTFLALNNKKITKILIILF